MNMYRNYTKFFRTPNGYIPKLLLVMKLTTIILLISLVQVSAASFGQKITLNNKNITIDKVFREIQKQTGMGVFFKKSNFDKAKKIEVAFVNAPLEIVMEKVLNGTGMTYVVEENTIIVTAKEKSFLDRVVERWQNIDVTGRILDENGKPLVGANVKVKETGVSTSTDADGRFTLRNVDENAIIQISYIGYKTKEVKAEKNFGEMKMEIGNSELEEVTVSTGYWTTTKRKSVGNIVKVDAKEIENQPVTSPLMALQGRVAGLEVSPTSGAPGSAVSLKIRGRNSLRTLNADGIDGSLPLYIINGIQINSAPIYSSSNSLTVGGIDPLNSINPSDIESIEVLKDADATAIYGSRGANGVILIKTKNRTNTDRSLNFNTYHGLGSLL